MKEKKKKSHICDSKRAQTSTFVEMYSVLTESILLKAKLAFPDMLTIIFLQFKINLIQSSRLVQSCLMLVEIKKKKTKPFENLCCNRV